MPGGGAAQRRAGSAARSEHRQPNDSSSSSRSRTNGRRQQQQQRRSSTKSFAVVSWMLAAASSLVVLSRSAQAFALVAPKIAGVGVGRAAAPLRPRAHLVIPRMSAATTGGGPRVYEEGQDPGEQFDLYEPPTAEEKAGAKVTKLRPLGVRKARARVHAEGDWHRAAHIWLVDDEGGLLLQQRSEFKDTFPGRWDVSVGGHVDAGEEIMPTAVRELEEELGLTGPLVQKLEHLFTLACTNRGETARHGQFTCNEFQEIFLLPVGPRHDLASYKYPPGEVTDIKVMHYRDLEAKLAAGDSQYVPRPPHYRQHLWAHLDERFGAKK